MYEFWYDYIKPKYGENAKLCYMNKDSFVLHVKAGDIYMNSTERFETRFDNLNFEADRTLPKGKNKKLIGLFKHKLGEKMM